ncbi:MAG: 30S ribosomal protein S2 [Candidatus Babeliaceae bacterium]|nr:30S ribosomal protein S2 [Candidatus Babeliaceae bacterium]
MIDLKQLIKSGVQFGHQTWRWNPKMNPYIWGHKNGIHLIDVSKTAFQLEKAAQFLESLASQGKSVLWVGTKKSAQAVLPKVLEVVKSPSVTHRWIGGTLTNYPQVKKSVTKMLHFEDILAKSESSHYIKKELNLFNKMKERLEKNVGGIRELRWPVGALVVVDVNKEHVAIKEAKSAGVPIVALVDTNSDPSGIDFVIPTNDDAPRALEVILAYLAEAVKRGQQVAATSKLQEEVIEDNSLDRIIETVLSEDGAEAERQKAKRIAGAARPQKRLQSRPAQRKA